MKTVPTEPNYDSKSQLDNFDMALKAAASRTRKNTVHFIAPKAIDPHEHSARALRKIESLYTDEKDKEDET